MEYKVDEAGDTTITLRRIRIRNIAKWEVIKKCDMKESKMAVQLSKISLGQLADSRDSDQTRRKSTHDWGNRKLIVLDGMNEAEGRKTFINETVDSEDTEQWFKSV